MNQSKMKDQRFWHKWFASGAVPKRPINLNIPFCIVGIVTNERTGWRTVSCDEGNKYVYFVTKADLDFRRPQTELPKDALELEQGLHLVSLYLGEKRRTNDAIAV